MAVFYLFVVVVIGGMITLSRLSGGSKKSQYEKELEKMEHNEHGNVESHETEENTFLGLSSGYRDIYTRDDANHIFVCGTTGSGKTVTLSNYIKSGSEKGYPMLIIDGKGDTGEGSILDIVNRFKGSRKLYTVNLADIEHSDKYNPFKNASVTVVKDMLINLTDWSEEHYKKNTERYLERLLNLLLKANISFSFGNIVSYMRPSKFLELNKKLMEEKTISYEEGLLNLELAKESESIIIGASARFSAIYESEAGKIFDKAGIDIYGALEEGSIILIVLNPLLLPELSPQIGRLVLIDAKKAVSKLYTTKKKRTFFILDEINVYASNELINLLNKSRSADITCIPATQSLSDLEIAGGRAFKAQVIENCNNYVIMRQNDADNAEEWSRIIGTRPTMERTFKIEEEGGVTEATGAGSAKKVREFIFHPDDIKLLARGEAFFVSKDTKTHTKMWIEKPF